MASTLVAPAATAASAAAVCPALADSYRASIDASFTNTYGVNGDAVSISGTGTAAVSGSATLEGAPGDYTGSLTGTASSSWSESSSGRQFSATSSGAIPDPTANPSTVYLSVDPATCAYTLAVTVSQRTSTSGPNGADTAVRETIRMTAAGTLASSGPTAGSAAMPGGLCSTDFGGYGCRYTSPPLYYPVGSASGSLAYTISPAGTAAGSLRIDSVTAQDRAAGETAWVDVTPEGTFEGYELRLVVRLTSDKPLAGKLRVEETTAGGYSRTAREWLVTNGGQEGWSAVLNLDPIPRSAGAVVRSFNVSVIHCPTSAPCSSAEQRETAPTLVNILLQPAITIMSMSYQTRYSAKAPWRPVPSEGVWRTDQVRVVFELFNTSTTTRAVGITMRQEGSSSSYADFWKKVPPGSHTMYALVNPSSQAGVFQRRLIAQLEFCPTSKPCAEGQRRLTDLSAATYVENPGLRVVPTKVAFDLLESAVEQPIPEGETYVRTALPENATSVLVVRVINEGTALYHRLVVREVTPGGRSTVTGAWRMTGSGPNGLDFRIALPGYPAHSGQPIAKRDFIISAEVCPSATPCASSDIRVVSQRLSIGVQPTVVATPSEIIYTVNGNSVSANIPDSGEVWSGISETTPFALRHSVSVLQDQITYRVVIDEVTPRATSTVSTPWRSAASAGVVSADASVIGLSAGRRTQRIFETHVEYCLGMTSRCASNATVSTSPTRLVVRVSPGP